VLKVMELVTSNSEEGIEEEACRWGGDIVVEERIVLQAAKPTFLRDLQ